jgi:peroxiredoxin 2/4
MAVLTGRRAPSFYAPAVINGNEMVDSFTLDQYLGQKYVVFFFYPADFTFVCPTELLAFQKHIKEFEKRNVVVVGCSTDSQFSHFQWLNTPRKQGGIQGVKYPLVADQSKMVSSIFGVLAGEYLIDESGTMQFDGTPMAYRGLFLLDKDGVVQHQVVNNMPFGRSIAETLRMIDALQHFEENGEVCPADWKKGDESILPSQEGIVDYMAKQ